MLRRSYGLLLTALLTLALAACGGAPAAQSPTVAPAAPTVEVVVAPTDAPAPTEAPSAAPAPADAPAVAGFPVTIENCGNTLTFEAPPERALVTYQNVAEILVALGLTDKIVGVTYGMAYPPPPEYQAEVEGLNYLSPPEGGSAVKEVALSTQPDLVIAAYPTYDFDPSQGLATEDDYRAAGAQIFGMSVECGSEPGAATIEDVYADILALGAIFGVSERADSLVSEMRERIAAVQQQVAGREALPVAFYDAGEEQIGVYGSGLNADMIRLAGGANVFADRPEVYLQVSQESFAATSPAIFAVLDYEGSPLVPDEEARAEFLFSTFPNMPASQARRWVSVSGAAFAAGIRIPDAVETMARAFHPEAFAATGGAIVPAEPDLAAFPVTIENCGRTLTFDAPPERIVTTYPNAAELLIRLGLGERIVGSMYHQDTPVSPEVEAAFNQIPTQYERYPSKEELVTLQADFALATYDAFDFSGENGMPTIDEAAALGLPVYGMSTECGGGVKTDATLSMIYEDVLTLGKIFGVEARAEALAAEMQGRVAAVQAKVTGATPLKATIYYGGEGPLGVFTNGIYGDLLALAGGATVFPDEPQNSAEISVEVLAAANPDVIFVLEYGTPFEQMRDYLRTTFPNIDAVKNDRIVLVDGGIFPPGYRNVEAVEVFAKAMHPEAFE